MRRDIVMPQDNSDQESGKERWALGGCASSHGGPSAPSFVGKGVVANVSGDTGTGTCCAAMPEMPTAR